MSKLLAEQFPSLTGDWKGIPKILCFLRPTGSFSNVEMYIEIVWTFISAYLLLSSPVPSTVPSYEPSTGVQYIEVIVDR